MGACHEGDVEFTVAHHELRIARRAFGYVYPNVRVLTAESLQQPIDEATGHQGMDTNPNVTFLATRLHPGRLDRTIEDAHCILNLIDETASGFGQSDAAGIAVEQDNAKVLLQHLDPCADARLTGAEREGGAVEAEIFCNGEHLDECHHRNASSG